MGVLPAIAQVNAHSVEQAGRISQLRPGDLVVVDPARPARYTRSAAEHVTVLVPRAMLPLRPAEVLPHLPVYIPGDQGTGALASTLIRQLPRHMEDYQAAEAAQLGTAVADLLAVALASRLDRARDLPQETRQAALLQQRLGQHGRRHAVARIVMERVPGIGFGLFIFLD